MRNVIFARSVYGKLLLNLLQHTRIQAGVELTAYLEQPENSKFALYKFHHDVNQIHKELRFEKVSVVNINFREFDKIYIVGPDFDLRQRLINAGGGD